MRTSRRSMVLDRNLLAAPREIARHKLRSFLAALGIAIGVAAVVAMVAIGRGARRAIEDQIQSLGVNVLKVSPGSALGASRVTHGRWTPITERDAAEVLETSPAVRAAAPILSQASFVVKGGQVWATTAQGTDLAYFEIRDWRVARGALFTKDDVEAFRSVCVLGSLVARRLFGREDPVGELVRLHGLPFRVVGVLEEKGYSFGGRNLDDVAIVPYTTFQKKVIRSPGIMGLYLSARSPAEVEAAKGQVTAFFRQKHKIPPGRPDDFAVEVLSEVLVASSATADVMTLLLAAIASVSLLVGGVGIMNIMLVSVTERTREIGLRMAVGASERDILVQFLAEASVLCLAGGAVGIALGTAAAYAVSRTAGWPVALSPGSALIAFALSAAIGLFFGYYPARRAARLEPMAALRYE